MAQKTFGSKAEVWHSSAKKTVGNLTKHNLMKNKHGRIVSRRKHALGKKSIKHLQKLGYKATKGKFKLFHKGHTKGRKSRGTRKRGGGMTPLSPHSYDGKGTGTSGVGLQFVAGNAA
jgi:hypothetical protein